jgi:hypothetical protein
VTQEQRRRVNLERSRGDLETAWAAFEGTIGQWRRVDDGTSGRRRRGSDDLTRRPVKGITGIVLVFARQMTVEWQRANVPYECQR